jgi:5,10-methylenetetrahydromethanopterin reductase
MQVQLFHHAFPTTGVTAPMATRLESAGWDGLMLADSQHLVADPFMELLLAAGTTRTLLLGTAATNPVTRDPAVMATSMLTLQAESSDRAILGIARGDSALSHLGLSPAPIPEFERSLHWLRAYLHGDPVDRGGVSAAIEWIRDKELRPVPLDVHVTGPRVLRMAAVIADRITLAVGAQPAWVSWAVGEARQARESAGLDPAGLQIGGFFMAAAGHDPTEASDLVRGNVAIFAHIAGRGRSIPGVVPESKQTVIAQVADAYDPHQHGTSAAPAAQLLPEAFIRWFAAVGSSTEVADRLGALCALGLQHLVLVGPARDESLDRSLDAASRFDTEVIPALRRG